MAMTDSEFQARCSDAIERLNHALGPIVEEHDIEVNLQNGVLSIETEDPTPGKIIISPNAPARQIWISALSTSFKLDLADSGFVYARTGESLPLLVSRVLGEQLHSHIDL